MNENSDAGREGGDTLSTVMIHDPMGRNWRES